MLRVLHIIPTLKMAGAERLVLDICHALTEKKLAEVLLVVMYNENEFPEYTRNINVRFCSSRVYPSVRRRSKAELTDFIRIIEDFKPDIIHSHLFEAEMLSRWTLFPGINYVSHCHDNMHQLKKPSLMDFLNKKRITEVVERKLLLERYRRCNNNFIVISQNMKDYFLNNLHLNEDQVYLLHNAINFKRFNKGLSLKTFQGRKNDLTLLTVGRLVKRKNHGFLIDVVKYLAEKKINVKLFIIGTGEEKDDLGKKVLNERLQDKIKFVGNTASVEEYYHQADIYVHSSTNEPFGLVLLEANAAGLPVVCLDGGGNRDIVSNGQNGYILNDPDVPGFSETILKIINDKSLYNELSKNSIEFAGNFDMDSYIIKLYSYYQDLTKT
jgi:glycosyltransferase involved in cell wall biosynthesis